MEPMPNDGLTFDDGLCQGYQPCFLDQNIESFSCGSKVQAVFCADDITETWIAEEERFDYSCADDDKLFTSSIADSQATLASEYANAASGVVLLPESDEPTKEGSKCDGVDPFWGVDSCNNQMWRCGFPNE